MVGEQELVLNGMGLREKFWVDVYVGALYLPEPAEQAGFVFPGRGLRRDAAGKTITLCVPRPCRLP